MRGVPLAREALGFRSQGFNVVGTRRAQVLNRKPASPHAPLCHKSEQPAQPSMLFRQKEAALLVSARGTLLKIGRSRSCVAVVQLVLGRV